MHIHPGEETQGVWERATIRVTGEVRVRVRVGVRLGYNFKYNSTCLSKLGPVYCSSPRMVDSRSVIEVAVAFVVQMPHIAYVSYARIRFKRLL